MQKKFSGSELLEDIETEVAERISKKLQSVGFTEKVSEESAKKIGQEVADYLALAWGGLQVYFPKDQHRRGALIYKEFNGQNIKELAQKFGLCEQHIYKVIKKQQKINKNQGNLLDW